MTQPLIKRLAEILDCHPDDVEYAVQFQKDALEKMRCSYYQLLKNPPARSEEDERTMQIVRKAAALLSKSD